MLITNYCKINTITTKAVNKTTINRVNGRNKVFPYAITSFGHGADPGFVAVSPQATYLVVGCRYFPPGPGLLSQPNKSPPWPVPNYTAW